MVVERGTAADWTTSTISTITMIKPQRSHKFVVGLKFMRATFVADPADTEGLITEIEALRPAVREVILWDVRAFYYRHSALEKTGSARGTGKGRVEKMPTPELVRQLQQMVLASPLYGIYENPDHGRRDLPARLPLSAFDAQKPHEPLRLS